MHNFTRDIFTKPTNAMSKIKLSIYGKISEADYEDRLQREINPPKQLSESEQEAEIKNILSSLKKLGWSMSADASKSEIDLITIGEPEALKVMMGKWTEEMWKEENALKVISVN